MIQMKKFSYVGEMNEHEKSENNANEGCKDGHCEWNIMEEIDYFNEIKEEIKKVPRELQVQCLLQISETAQNYILQC